MYRKLLSVFFSLLFLNLLHISYAGEQILVRGLQKLEVFQDNSLSISYKDIVFASDFSIVSPNGKIIFPDRNITPERKETMEGIELLWKKDGLTLKLTTGVTNVSIEWESESDVLANFCVKDSAVNKKDIKIKDVSGATKEDTLSFDKAFPDSDRTGILSLTFLEDALPILSISSTQPFSFKDYRKNKGYVNKWLASTEKIDKKGSFLMSFGIERGSFVALDISKQCNMGFRDTHPNDGEGGWSDDGPDNDLKNFPTGIITFNNIPFKVIDPASNNGKSCIVLKGNSQHGENFPDAVTIHAQPIKANKVYILHGTTWTPANYNGPVAIYRFFYDDGSFDEFEVVNNRDIIDWWFAPQKGTLENFTLAWEGSSGERWAGVGISSFSLKSNKSVVKVEIRKANTPEGIVAIPGIIGLTFSTFSETDIPVSSLKAKIYPTAPPLNILVYGAGNLREDFDEKLHLEGLKIDEFSGLSEDTNVVIIGQSMSKSYLSGIEEFVKKGGGILIALPPEDNLTNYLKDILPVDVVNGRTINVEKNLLIRPVVVNENHPAITDIDWKPYPGLPVYYRVKAKDDTDVLLRWSNGDPGLVVWKYGAGRVAYFSSPLRIDFGQIYLANEFHDYWLFLIRLAYWLSGNEEYAKTLGYLGKSQRLRDTLTDRMASLRTFSEDIIQMALLTGENRIAEATANSLEEFYSDLSLADNLLANARFREAFNSYNNLLKEITSSEAQYKEIYNSLKENLLQNGYKKVEVQRGNPIKWGMHGILQYSNTEETNNSAIREYSIGFYLDTIKKLGMNTFVQGGGTNRFIKKSADPSTVEEEDLQLDIYDDYIRAARARDMTFFIHLDGRESIHDNFDGNYDYLHQGFIEKLPYPEKQGRAKGAEAHPFDRYNEEALARYNKVLRIIASRYKDEPTIIGYNTDNETHNLYWQTEEAREQFQKYLLNKYGSVEKINKSLGYNFSAIEEIKIPQEKDVKQENLASSPLKALWYEWKEFENWISWRYFWQYKNAIKSVSPEKKLMDRYSPNYAIGHGTYNPYGDIPYNWITSLSDITGLHIGREFNLDYMAGYRSDALLGLSEYYPLVWDGPYNASFRLLPGLGGPWAVPEMKGEIDNYASYTRNFWLVFSRDVSVILDHAMGNGRNFLPDELSHSNPYGFGYFRYGVYGMKYVNSVYTDIRGEIDGSNPYLPVAIMEPNESRIQTISSPIAEDVELLPRESSSIYNTLCRPLFFTPDVIPVEKDLSSYKVLIVPYSLYIKETTQRKIEEFVKNGGVLLLTGPAGLYDEISKPSGYLLKQIWGINKTTRENMCQGKIKFSDESELPAPNINKRWLFELTETPSIKVIATYSDGKPAIIESSYGKGKAFITGWPFLKTSSPVDLLKKTIIPFLPKLLEPTTTDVYIYPRRKGNDLIFFVVNRMFERQTFNISLVKEVEIVDLRLALGRKTNNIKCDLLPGEGRVFKLKDYFLQTE